MEEEKYYCEMCDNEIPKPQMCCSGHECGCMGLPIEPPVCSEKCYKALIDKYSKLSKNKKRASIYL